MNQQQSEYIAGLLQARDLYKANADHAIRAVEFRKASELLWGAITQQLKAFAASRNILITSHRQFFEFLRQLASELSDKTIYTDFIHLNALHKNFYDEIIPPDSFPEYYEKAQEYIDRLESLSGNAAD